MNNIDKIKSNLDGAKNHLNKAMEFLSDDHMDIKYNIYTSIKSIDFISQLLREVNN